MIELVVEPFELSFMRHALLVGLLVVLTTSLVGTWVVLRGLSFLGDALAHGVVPGIAAAQLLGLPVIVGAGASVVVMVAGIEAVRRTTRLSDDVGIGLLFVGMLSLGVVIVSRADAPGAELNELLFGDVLGAARGDLAGQVAAAVLVAMASVVLYRPLLALAVDEEQAALLGMRPRLAHLAMLALVSVAIVASFRAVGTLLVFGLMVAPPATAVLLVRRVPAVMATAVLLGATSVVAGLLLSYHHDVAAAASISAVAVAQFVGVVLIRLVNGARPRSMPGRSLSAA